MMRRRNGETSHSLLDLVKVGRGRQLSAPKELSRNGEKRTITASETERPLSSLGTVLNPSKTKGRCRNQSDPAKREPRAEMEQIKAEIPRKELCPDPEPMQL